MLAKLKILYYNQQCTWRKHVDIISDARLAQLVEHLTLNQGVQGSSP